MTQSKDSVYFCSLLNTMPPARREYTQVFIVSSKAASLQAALEKSACIFLHPVMVFLNEPLVPHFCAKIPKPDSSR